MKKQIKKLSDLLVKVTLPCLIVSSFNYNFTGDMIKKRQDVFYIFNNYTYSFTTNKWLVFCKV